MKTIVSYEAYAVTKAGRVWSKKTRRFLKPELSKIGGYLRVALCKNGKAKTYQVHCLVLTTFVGSCPVGMECRHLDGNLLNNNLKNLKWGTRSENAIDAVKHGRHNTLKLTESKVRLIRLLYAAKWLKFTYKELGELFSVAPQNICYIANKKSWKHV